MPRPKLGQAAKTRAAAQAANPKKLGNRRTAANSAPTASVASASASAQKTTQPAIGVVGSLASGLGSNIVPSSRGSLALPGLPTLTENDIDGQLPSVNPDAYTVSDPHKLPDTLPQVSDAQYEENKRIAKSALNAQNSEILALQITSGKFQIIGQKAKTVGDGVRAVTEIEKTKGLLIDLRNQQEITAQKTNALDFNIYKTDKEVAISAFNKQALDEKERMAGTSAQSQKADADYAEIELAKKLQKLGLT